MRFTLLAGVFLLIFWCSMRFFGAEYPEVKNVLVLIFTPIQLYTQYNIKVQSNHSIYDRIFIFILNICFI